MQNEKRVRVSLPFRVPRSSFRVYSGRSYWPVLAFLVGFSILLIFVCFYFLVPAMEAATNATAREQKGLGAYSWLLMAVILIILLAGLMLTFRIGRFFFPRPAAPRSQTKYVDAWTEAGKRMQTSNDDPDA